MICISRPANGITLNAGIREFLCEENGNIIQFENNESASAFLVGLGFNADDFVDIIYHEVCKNCGEPLELYGECFTCGKPDEKS